MAKKSKDALYEEFLADLKSLIGDDTKWAGVEEALLKNDKASSKLRDGVLAKSEFSSQMDALSARETEVNNYLAQERAKIEGWQTWYGTVTQEVAAKDKELNAYKTAYGNLDTNEQHREAAKHGMTKEDFESELNKTLQSRDMNNLKFVDDLTDLKIEHRDRFKEKLDTTAVYKIAGERQLPLDAAYKEYISDRVETLRKTEYEEAIKRAKEEGAAEALSKHNLPILNTSSEYVHFLDSKAPLATEKERVSAAVDGFLKLTAQRRT